MRIQTSLMFLVSLAVLQGLAIGANEDSASPESTETISFYRQVRPILQRHCSGCHQPAKKKGKLLLTTYAGLKAGGQSGEGFEAGDPEFSLIFEYISGDEPLMPPDGDPLAPQQVELIAQWIQQGAVDDTPAQMQAQVGPDNPPAYLRPPVVTALAYSPDGKTLAVSGFHEVILYSSDGSERKGRLIGRSQRIESVRFSPDGSQLAAVGGVPSLFGEVQLWDVAKRELKETTTVGHDTLFGARFSDDGKQLAFGGADNRARVINVEDMAQVMQLDAHADWVLGTTFSLKNDHLITVSRDRSMKLTIVESGQFVDNITSITPGALKGGLSSVERHPTREQVLTGGADGEPRLYKIFRTQTRRIGDDFNKIRAYPRMPGRIFDLKFNKDGSQFVVGSSTATNGEAWIFTTEDGKVLHKLDGIESPVFAVAFRPDGQEVAAAGFDGTIRIFDVESGKPVTEFVPVEILSADATTD